jgi:hypothetical protein
VRAPRAEGRRPVPLLRQRHIVSTEADVDAQTITLDVEGQTTSADVIFARLAAAARL